MCGAELLKDIQTGEIYEEMHQGMAIRTSCEVAMKNRSQENAAKKTLIVMGRNIYQVYKKLDEIQQQLEQSNKIFIRSHKSYLANLSHVRRVSVGQILLNNGEML